VNCQLSTSPDERLARQIGFIIEIDKAKQVLRRTLLMDGSRLENDAEHSWHLAVMAILLAEYADGDVDLLRVLKMVLIHDLVEIDAGDTFVYDTEALATRCEREERAADRIFGLLPPDLGSDVRAIWEEFEEQATPEARFAAALDRLQPLLHNYQTEGGAWRRHGITSDRVRERNQHIAAGSPTLWEFARSLIDEAVRRGYMPE